MAQTDSEKLLGDTLRKLEADGLLTWGHKFEPQIRGEKYRTAAPIDFLAVTRGPNPCVYFIEVKEVGGTSIGYSLFKPKQRRLLMELPNAFLLLRFYSPDYRRNNIHFWEHYFWVAAKRIMPADSSVRGSITLAHLLNYMQADVPERWVTEIASHSEGQLVGINETSGLTSRRNPMQGFTDLPFNLPKMATPGEESNGT